MDNEPQTELTEQAEPTTWAELDREWLSVLLDGMDSDDDCDVRI